MLRPCVAIVLALTAASSIANDGWLSYGGTPKLMKGHRQVRMVSEVVRMTIHKDHMIVDCRFVFKNRGGPIKVCMGFPDYDSDPHVDEEYPAKTTFDWFRSYINGVPTRTKFTAGVNGEAWQVKTVAFNRGEAKGIRDAYRVPLGVGMLSREKNGKAAATHYADYILHTGASWLSTIERSEIIVTFASDAPMKPGSLRIASNSETLRDSFNYISKRPNNVFISGPSKPLVSGRTIRFIRRYWRPSEEDDVHLQFGFSWRKPG